LANEGLHTLQT